MARENPNMLLGSPVFVITFSVSRLKAETNVHPMKLKSCKGKDTITMLSLVQFENYTAALIECVCGSM